jgi:LacI family transcriptional regulator
MRRVALIYDATEASDIKVLSGVAAYLHEGVMWNIFLRETSLKEQRLPDLHSWHGDGIIANFDDPHVAAAVMHVKLPTVGFGGGYGWYSGTSQIPYFCSNNEAVARLAADHLLDRGFRHFAYCGLVRTPTNGWSEERGRAFADCVKRRGFTCHIYRGRHKVAHAWSDVMSSLSQWLASLPKPVGLMVARDRRARQVLEACRVSGLRVPDDVAVIGVDNNELMCQLTNPWLTSIDLGPSRIGYQAAALLDRMMAGEQSRQTWFRIDPVGVVTRRSTDILAVEDPRVTNAMAFVREHACEGITVRDVVAAMPMGRSRLETLFKAALGRSIHKTIRRVQLDRAFGLIQSSDLPLKEIAAKAGFKTVQQMSVLFSKRYGSTPARCRGQVRTRYLMPPMNPSD